MFLTRLKLTKFTQLYHVGRYQIRNLAIFRKHAVSGQIWPQYLYLRKFSSKSDIAGNPVLSATNTVALRRRTATSLQKSFINDLISENSNPTEEDWKELKEKLCKIEFGTLTSSDIPNRVIQRCISTSNLNAARSYLKYMRENGIKYSAAVVTGFIRICYENRTSLTNEDHELLDRFVRFLLAKYKILDTFIGEALMKGMCLKNDWEKCASVLEEIKTTVKPTPTIVSSYVLCLLDNNKFEKAWEVINEYAQYKFRLLDDVYVSYINKKKSEVKEIERLLEFFKLNDIVPHKIVCDHLITVFSQLSPDERLKASYTSIRNNGRCSSCNEKLNRVDITDEEFDTLRDEFLNKVLKRDDVFKNTTPEELKKFKLCVERNVPFDIVIDGLNVVYMQGSMKSPEVYTKLLTSVVQHFVDQGQKVLVIGRNHMRSYSKESLDYLRKICSLFFIDDNSEDDPYMIYSTLKSGPDACFVSRDLMRSEKCKLDNEKIEYLFKRWQLSHQIFINFISLGTGKVYIKPPTTFETSAQRSKSGWHIPYYFDSDSCVDEYGVHQHWLCLHK